MTKNMSGDASQKEKAYSIKNVCVFCFKTHDSLEKQNLEIIKQFLKILKREEIEDEIRGRSRSFEASQKILNCCTDCKVVITSYCEMYHQLSSLKLQMDWKIMCLVENMKISDNVRLHLKALHMSVTSNETGSSNQNGDYKNLQTNPSLKTEIALMKSFRKSVLIKCQKRLMRSLPRIVLKRCKSLPLQHPVASVLNSQKNLEFDLVDTDNHIDYESDYEPHDDEIPLENDNRYVEETSTPLIEEEQSEDSCHVQVIRIKMEGEMSGDDMESSKIVPSEISPGTSVPSRKIIYIKTRKHVQTPKDLKVGKQLVKGYHCRLCNFSTKTYKGLRIHKRSIRHKSQQKLHLFNQQTIKIEIQNENAEADGASAFSSEEDSNSHDHDDNVIKSETPKYSLRDKKKRSYTDAMKEVDSEASQVSDASSDGGSSIRSRSSSSESRESTNDLEDGKSNKIGNSRGKRSGACNLDGCSHAINTKEHQKLHASGAFKCLHCKVIEENVMRLSLHELSSHSTHKDDHDPVTLEKILHCPRCPYETKSIYRYKVHFAAAHIPGFESADKRSQGYKIWCEICQLPIQRTRRETHFKVMHDKSGVGSSHIRKCRYEGCPAYFVWRQENHIAVIRQMSKHKLNLHGRTTIDPTPNKGPKRMKFPRKKFVAQPENTVVCPETNCPEKFVPPEDMESHRKLHGDFHCSFCDMATTFAPELAVHEADTHPPTKTGSGKRDWKKAYSCPRCNRNFYEHKTEFVNHFITDHLKIVTVNPKDKKKCPICNAESKTNNDNRFLNKHFRQCHKTDGLEPSEIYRCGVCPAYFIKALQLHQHNMKTHVKNKCLECGIPFTNGKKLKRHMEREHPNCSAFFGTLPFNCNFDKCGRRFASEIELSFHRNNHENANKPLICQFCGDSFVHIKNLDSHLASKHKDQIN